MCEITTKNNILLAVVCGAAATLSGIGLARFAFTALVPDLISQQWYSDSFVAYLGAANLLGYMLGALVANRMGGLWGTTRVLRCSAAVVMLSYLGMAWSGQMALAFTCRLTSGMAGGALMALAPPVMTATLAPEQRRSASAFIFVGIGMGILLSAFVSGVLAEYSLYFSWIVLAILAAVPFLILQFVWHGEVSSLTTSTVATPLSTSRRRVLQWLVLVYILDAAGYIPHTVFWVDYLQRYAQFSTTASAVQWALFGVGAIMGPFFVGRCAGKYGWNTTLILCVICKAMAIGLALFVNSSLAIAVSSFGVGALVTGVVAAMSGRIGEVVGPQRQVKYWGVATAAFACSQGVFAYVFAYIYTVPSWLHFDGASVSFALGAFALLLAALLLVLSSLQSNYELASQQV